MPAHVLNFQSLIDRPVQRVRQYHTQVNGRMEFFSIVEEIISAHLIWHYRPRIIGVLTSIGVVPQVVQKFPLAYSVDNRQARPHSSLLQV